MSKDSISIGRNSACDIRIDGIWDVVSNRHADIVLRGNRLFFIDHSTNGSYLNGRSVHHTEVEVNYGDVILLAGKCPVDWAMVEQFFPRQAPAQPQQPQWQQQPAQPQQPQQPQWQPQQPAQPQQPQQPQWQPQQPAKPQQPQQPQWQPQQPAQPQKPQQPQQPQWQPQQPAQPQQPQQPQWQPQQPAQPQQPQQPQWQPQQPAQPQKPQQPQQPQWQPQQPAQPQQPQQPQWQSQQPAQPQPMQPSPVQPQQPAKPQPVQPRPVQPSPVQPQQPQWQPSSVQPQQPQWQPQQNATQLFGGGAATAPAPQQGSKKQNQSDVSRKLDSWNWGAFLGSFVWAAYHKKFWPLVMIPLAFIPYIGQVANLWISSYLGYNGYKIAWKTGKYTYATLEKSAKIWLALGIVIFLAVVAGSIFALRFTIDLI